MTAYELKRDGIPITLITDNMAAYVMRKGLVNLVIEGADRIVQDAVFNKIGTYGVALLAYHHKIPFYVAAPGSIIDFEIETGERIKIEERDPDEIKTIMGEPIVGDHVMVMNPAFDLVPNKLVSAIITEYKVHYPPYNFAGIRQMFNKVSLAGRTFSKGVLRTCPTKKH